MVMLVMMVVVVMVVGGGEKGIYLMSEGATLRLCPDDGDVRGDE